MPTWFQKNEIRDNMTIVYKKRKMTFIFIDRLKEYGLKSLCYNGQYGFQGDYITQAVGLYTIAYASQLQSPEIHLIGYDYRGVDNDGVDMSEIWIERTNHYFKNRKICGYKDIIVDHSGGDFPV